MSTLHYRVCTGFFIDRRQFIITLTYEVSIAFKTIILCTLYIYKGTARDLDLVPLCMPLKPSPGAGLRIWLNIN